MRLLEVYKMSNKIAGTWIKIETKKFPILAGEENEVVNEGMYGKALCQYLESTLPQFGLTVNFYCAEDWGWWVDITELNLNMGLLIYAHTVVGADPESYAIGSSITKPTKWSWKKFRKIDVSAQVTSMMNKLQNALEYDEDIYEVERYDEFPEFE